METKLNIIVDPVAMLKIKYWVDVCHQEISGMGTVKKIGDTLYVSEVFLLDQEVTGADTEITAAAMGKLEFELHKAKNADSLNFWWHSHVNMGTFWSGTDHAQMKEFAEAGWIAAAVFNKKGDIRAAYRQGAKDFYPELFMDNIAIKSEYMIGPKLKAALKKEFVEKVKTRKYVAPKGQKYRNYDHGYGTVWCNEAQALVDPAKRSLRLPEPANKPKGKGQNKGKGKKQQAKKISLVADDTPPIVSRELIEEWSAITKEFYGERITDDDVIDFIESYGDDVNFIEMKDAINTNDVMNGGQGVF